MFWTIFFCHFRTKKVESIEEKIVFFSETKKKIDPKNIIILSASVEKFSVSHMQDFLFKF